MRVARAAPRRIDGPVGLRAGDLRHVGKLGGHAAFGSAGHQQGDTDLRRGARGYADSREPRAGHFRGYGAGDGSRRRRDRMASVARRQRGCRPRPRFDCVGRDLVDAGLARVQQVSRALRPAGPAHTRLPSTTASRRASVRSLVPTARAAISPMAPVPAPAYLERRPHVEAQGGVPWFVSRFGFVSSPSRARRPR
jgi:hypothetical protein